MNTADNLYERIDAYLQGSMAEADRQAFETSMEADPALQEEVELQQLVHKLILEKGLSDIRRQVGKDLAVKNPFPWGEISFITLCVLVTGLLCYVWVKPFEADTAVQNIPEVAAAGVKKPGSAPEATGTIPEQKSKDTRVAEIQYRQEPVAVSQPAAQQVQHTAPDGDAAANTNRQAAEPQQQQQQPEKINTQDVSRVPCPDIVFNVHTEASCRNGHTGSVQLLLSGIAGGQPPYSYTVDGESASLRTGLPAGTYTVAVTDSRGCLAQQQATVKEKNCTVFKDYSFNPDVETLKWPFTDTENGTLAIMDKSGNVVYKTDIANGQPYEWNGRSMNGSSLETGSYLYIATFTNGESKQGYIILLH